MMSSSKRDDADLPCSIALILKRFLRSMSTNIVVLCSRFDIRQAERHSIYTYYP